MKCPICGYSFFSDFLKCPAYKVCLICNLYCQETMPEKVYEGPEENNGKGPGAGHQMSNEEKNVNINLANALYNMFLPCTALDIGCKYPIFLHTLKDKVEVLGIDGISEAVKYGQELDVPVVHANFESMDITPYKDKFDLITLIHTFEHFYNPLETIKKVLECLSSRGVLYIRIPNMDVEGIDRDFTEHHLAIHPYIYSSQAMYMLSEKLGYEIFRIDDLGSGQSDFYLRKRKDKFTLSVCMIVKDEEKNITDCLESIKNVTDEFVIVDTGSTDKTKEVVSKYTSNIYDFKWIDDFSAARNFSLSRATGDFILWCFHPDTRICSKKGYIPIKEIKINDRVLTHTGEFKKVGKLYKRSFKGDLFKVITNLKEEFIVTENHKFYSCKGYQCKTGIKFCKPDCRKQYSKRYLEKYGKLSRQCKQGYKDYKFQFNEIQFLNKGDILCFPILKDVIKEDVILDIKKFWGNRKNFKRIPDVRLEKDLMRLFGYYIAEGTSCKGGVTFCFHRNEKEYHKDVLYLMKKHFNIEGKVYYSEKRGNVVFNSVVLRLFFDDLFGKYSLNISIPEEFLLVEDSFLIELVRGLYRGDGNNTDSICSITTISNDLIYKLKLIFSRIGLSGYVTSYKAGRNKAYKMNVGGKQLRGAIRNVFEDSIRDNRGLYNKYFYKDENYIYYQIRSIEKIPYEGPVYNLKIEEDKTYVAGFALCHNCDADDVVENPEEIPPLLRESFDAHDFNIIYGNDNFSQARLFRNFRNIRFAGRVHEYPVLDGLFFQFSTNLPTPQRIVSHQRDTKINVRHKTEKYSTEDRSERNHRILRKELEGDPDNSRALFYLGNALKEMKRYDEAIEIYRKYLNVSTWRDEKWMAQKYIGCIFQWRGYYKEAIEELRKAIEIDDRWAESYYYIGEIYFLLKDYDKCIDWMLKAVEKEPPNSPLWKEMTVYQDAPYRYIFVSYDVKGDHKKAIHYCKRACEKKPGDEWLKGRLLYFEDIMKGSLKVFECYRQGALGDCLMTTAALRGLKKKYPGCLIRYVTHSHSMQILEGNKYIDELVSESKEEQAEKIYFSYPDKDSFLGDEGYPGKPLNRHLVKIFNECAGLPDNSMEMECTLSEEEEKVGRALRYQYKKYLTIHVKSGWSSYKDWYNDRWELVVEQLFKRGYVTLQVGHKEDFLLRNTIDFRGRTIKEVVSAIKYADVHMGIDSFTNHVSATVLAPSVILFGSTSPTGSGYGQNINIYKNLSCQPCYREYKSKDPCPNGKKCMKLISVDEVLKAVVKLLEEEDESIEKIPEEI